MDVTAEHSSPAKVTIPERTRFDGVGVDSMLKQRLSDMADEVGARNTRVAIAVPVREIIAIFHDVFGNVPHVPDYDPEREGLRWGGLAAYSPTEVPEAQAEVGVKLTDEGVSVVFETHDTSDDAPLTLRQAEEFFLAGLAAVAEGKRRAAQRPTLGVSDEDATAELARRGIVVESLTPSLQSD
ncbi:hypothetical protein [Actinophytocola sp.]|uniref:hypothetical protein n=1 Tax=Actinophytocola sp. TaxID=1872138 RepID=UPI002D80EB15|nr:hypothetical protein [Actinophytocola sp.]HET9144049.1 hypothetical protein [Actinophytocola sp.]